MGKAPKNGENILITGAFGYFGRSLLSALLDEPGENRFIALDVKPIQQFSRGETDLHRIFERYPQLSHYHLDLTQPTAPDELAGILKREEVDTVVHLAYLSLPNHQHGYVHELETVGTRYLLEACELADIDQIILLSSTMCYGAAPQNPLYLAEEHPLPQKGRRPSWLKHRIEADLEAQYFQKRHPKKNVMIIRMAPGIAKEPFSNIWTKFFELWAIPSILGYDPLIQFIHTDDAIRAMRQSVLSPQAGIFNVAPTTPAQPLSKWVGALNKQEIPVTRSLLSNAASLLWRFQLGHLPPGFEAFLQWPFCVDGHKFVEAYGFEFRWDTALLMEAFPNIIGQNGSVFSKAKENPS